MTDKRAYFKVDVGYLANPKVATLLDEHPRAILLHLQCIAYSAQHLTDGVVPMRLAMRLACAMQCDVDLLVQCGLLEQVDDTRVAVHDYLEHQRPASVVKTASDRAKRAAKARWDDAEGNADGNASGMRNAMQREREERERSSSSEIAAAPPTREDVERLCDRLAEHIESNTGKRPNITRRWRDAARLMIDRDNRTEQQIAWMIDWCQRDQFWHSNILSMPKLREKFDQMLLKARPQAVPQQGLRLAANGEPYLPPALDDKR